MAAANAVITRLFDLILLPFKGGAWPAMVWVSLLTAFFMLWVFKLTSNQNAVRRAKDAVKAHLLEMRLYQDNFRVMLRAEAGVLKANFRYMAANTRPLLVMILPLVLILAQLNLRFAYEPLRPGQETIVKLKLKKGVDPSRLRVEAEPGPGLELTAPAVRIPDEMEFDFRLRALEPGERTVAFIIGGERIEKTVKVGGGPVAKIVARRPGASFFDRLLYPGERPLPRSSPVAAVLVDHSARRLELFGLGVHWLVAYFILSILFGLAFKGLFKVEI
jgi:hypothetical protein